jgi:hypothetical protein
MSIVMLVLYSVLSITPFTGIKDPVLSCPNWHHFSNLSHPADISTTFSHPFIAKLHPAHLSHLAI